MDINTRLHNFLNTLTQRTPLDECIKTLKKNYLKSTSKIKIKNLLHDTPHVAFDKNNNIVTRRILFNDVRFRIKQTEFEQKNDILFTGHRFMPFLNNNIAYEDIQLLAPDNTPIPIKHIKIAFKDVGIYYSLLPPAMMKPAKIISRETGIFEVWDMDYLKKHHNLTDGATIIAKCLDFNKGRYRLTIDTAKNFQQSFARIRKSDTLLEDALLYVFETSPDKSLVESQLFSAYACADPWILHNPGHHFGGLLKNNQLIALTLKHARPLLIKKSKKNRKKKMSIPEKFEQTGTTKSLEDILEDIGCSFQDFAIKAIIRNCIWQHLPKKECIAITNSWVVPYGSREFAGRSQEKAYDNFIDKLYTKLKREDREKPLPQIMKNLTNGSLKLTLKLNRIFRELDAIPGLRIEDLPGDEFENLVEINAMIAHFLEFADNINTKKSTNEEENPAQIIQELKKLDEAIDQIYREMMEKLNIT